MKKSPNKIRYYNLTQLESFKEISRLSPPTLKNVLDLKRVYQYESTMDLGNGEKLSYNYAAKQVTDKIIDALQDIADEQQLIAKYREIASGEIMNPSENRRVLHHLMRGKLVKEVICEGKDLRKFYQSQQNRIAEFSEEIHRGRITNPNGKPFTAVVQVGIGGSDLGPRALYIALKNYVQATIGKIALPAHFISNIDPDDCEEIMRSIDSETTLFILVSKSGTTQETLSNMELIVNKLKAAGVSKPKKHIVWVTSVSSPMALDSDYLDIFFIDDFIGGRYSATSAVGAVVLSLAFGHTIFEGLLEGAAAVDREAMKPKLRENAPMLDALIGIWERNVQGIATTAVLPYSQALRRFPAHLQQLDMESNGKAVNRFGEALDYQTGPIVFGEPGTNGQHSFYQLLHQGSDIIALQFIGFQQSQSAQDLRFDNSTNQEKLNANLVAQIVAFACGQKHENPNKHFSGERPSSLLYANRLSPLVLGALLAHFENKIMFQGLVWNINSFDQEGVQLGKLLAKQILRQDQLSPELLSFSQIFGLRQKQT